MKIPIILLLLSLLAAMPLLAEDEDAPELPSPGNPNVAKTVRSEDPPLDHDATKTAAKEAVRKSGAGDPLTPKEPLNSNWIQSGKFPHDQYQYAVGPDGRVYGKGDKIPEGAKTMIVDVTFFQGEWVASVEIGHEVGDDFETDAIETSGMDDPDKIGSDQGKGLESDIKNDERRRKFSAKDPETAIRQAIIRLQMSGALYDPAKDMPEIPKIQNPPSARDIEYESSRPEQVEN